MSSKDLLERMQRLKEEKLRKQQEQQLEKERQAAAAAVAPSSASREQGHSSSSHPTTSTAATTATTTAADVRPTFQADPRLTLRYRDPATDPLAAPFTAADAAALLGAVAGRFATAEVAGRKRGREETTTTVTTDDDDTGAAPRPLSAVLSPLITSHMQEGLAARGEGEEEGRPSGGGRGAAAAPLLADEEYLARCAAAEVDVYGHERAPCRDVDHFARDRKIAQGVYGVVFSAFEKATEEEGGGGGAVTTRKKYALKHIKKQWLEDSQIGFPPYVLREFDILLRLQHPNLLRAAELVLLDRTKDLAVEAQDRVGVLRTAMRDAAAAAGGEGEKGGASGAPSPPPPPATTTREEPSITVGGTRLPATTATPAAAAPLEPLTAVPTLAPLLPDGPPPEHKGGIFDPMRMQQEYGKDKVTQAFWTYYTNRDPNFIFIKHPLRKRKVTTVDHRHPRGHTSRVYYNENVKDVFLVMDYCSFDLKDYMLCCHPQTRVPLFHISSHNTHPDAAPRLLQKIKNILYQMANGLFFMHAHRILHRDLKTSNILLDKDGFVKICDFGLARFYREGMALTPTVVTLMYRAPEIYFQLYDYSHKLDVWSMGCIFAELFLKRPLFKAANEADHFAALCDVLGCPTEEQFPGLYQLPEAVRLLRELPRYRQESRLRALFFPPSASTSATGEKPIGRDAAVMTECGFDLLCRMLRWHPKDRISAEEVLRHPFFAEAPPPCGRAELLAPLPCSSAAPAPLSADPNGGSAHPHPHHHPHGPAMAATLPGSGTPPPPMVVVRAAVEGNDNNDKNNDNDDDDDEHSSTFASPLFATTTTATTTATENPIRSAHSPKEQAIFSGSSTSSSGSDSDGDEALHDDRHRHPSARPEGGSGSGKRAHRHHLLREEHADSAAEQLKLHANMDTDD